MAEPLVCQDGNSDGPRFVPPGDGNFAGGHLAGFAHTTKESLIYLGAIAAVSIGIGPSTMEVALTYCAIAT
jgi:hypothetical protein